MIRRILALTASELTIALRNRWVLIATVLMALFALVLTFAGSAPTGALGVDLLTVAVGIYDDARGLSCAVAGPCFCPLTGSRARSSAVDWPCC